MKTYYVIKHDHFTNASVNTERGYYASLNSESFRKVPVHAIIWSVKVAAASKTAAIAAAKLLRKEGAVA